MNIIPVTPDLGAEIRGVDLRTAGTDTITAIRQAFAEHSVLFIRDQDLTLDDQLAVTRKFGSVLRVPYVQGVASHPDVIAVLKEAAEKKISTFGGTWHSDFSFLAEPPAATLLYSVELPPVGGDTIWASQYLAYDALSTGLKALLDPLRAVHTGWPHGTMGPSPDVPVSKSIQMVRNDPSARPRGAAPRRADPSGHGQEGAVRQSGLHPAFRGNDGRGIETHPRLSPPAQRAGGVLLPLPLVAGHPHHVGQSLPDASRGQRLRRPPPPALPHHHGGRGAVGRRAAGRLKGLLIQTVTFFRTG